LVVSMSDCCDVISVRYICEISIENYAITTP
jgi:hypothetical protein